MPQAPQNPIDEFQDALPYGKARGRGANLNPGNRFENVRLHVLGEHLDQLLVEGADPQRGRQVATVVYRDHTRTIINRVDSPDVPFNWSINPYRGCEHGCIYCYARPDHERLGFSCGVDFETRIMAKVDAPQLLEKELARPTWAAETIAMAGDTDVYQPLEAKMKITRQCLEVMARCRQPVGIITKNHLVTRDIDLLTELAAHQATRVAISLTSLDRSLAGKMEPRASSPTDRLAAMRELAAAGIPVTAMIAPIIPGLTDREIPSLLQAAADAGATSAGFVMVRLPFQIKELFEGWLLEHFPDRANHVLNLIRQVRGGSLYDARFGHRKRGEGPVAQQIGQMFKVFVKRYGLDQPIAPLSGAAFCRPLQGGQMRLFD